MQPLTPSSSCIGSKWQYWVGVYQIRRWPCGSVFWRASSSSGGSSLSGRSGAHGSAAAGIDQGVQADGGHAQLGQEIQRFCQDRGCCLCSRVVLVITNSGLSRALRMPGDGLLPGAAGAAPSRSWMAGSCDSSVICTWSSPASTSCCT